MKAYLVAFVSIVLWGSSGAVGKLLLNNLSNVSVEFYSCIFAFIGLFIICLFTNKMGIIRSYKLKDFGTFALMGFLGVFLYLYFFYGGLALLPAQEGFIINYLWPIMVVLFAVPVLKDKLTMKKVIALLISFTGVGVVITQGNFLGFRLTNMQGVVLALAAAVVYGLFSTLIKKLHYEEFTSTMFYYLFASIYTFILILFTSSIPSISGIQTAGLLYLGVFCSGIAFATWFLALKLGDTAKMANLIFLTPFASLVFIYFLVGEKITLASIVGLVLIVIGILIQSTNSKAHPH